MKLIAVLNALAVVVLGGCAYIPDAQVNRPQFDDLIDSDGDGVINQRDLCAGSPAKSLVDNEGCALWSRGTKKELLEVDFDYDQASIRDDQRETLLQLAGVLEQYPNVEVELIGDTSPEGGAVYNQALAERRVSSIAAELMRLGVDQSRIRRHTYQDKVPLVIDALSNRRLRRTKAVLHYADTNQAQEAWTIYTAEEALEK